jgi:hypothetical protein
MASCLCKLLEGATFPFPVKALEDGGDDAVHAVKIHKAHHRPGLLADFDRSLKSAAKKTAIVATQRRRKTLSNEKRKEPRLTPTVCQHLSPVAQATRSRVVSPAEAGAASNRTAFSSENVLLVTSLT